MFTAIHHVKEVTTCSNVRISSHAFNKPVPPLLHRRRIESHNGSSARQPNSVIVISVVVIVLAVVGVLLFTYRHNCVGVEQVSAFARTNPPPPSIHPSIPLSFPLALDYPANNSARRRGDGNYFSLVKNEKCSTAE